MAAVFDDMDFRNHTYVGFKWPVTSTRTGEQYSIELTRNGFTCTCMGYFGRGVCKHIKQVHANLVSDEDDPVYDIRFT